MVRHILVLGAGSVGRRHMSNLVSLGCVVSAMDPRSDRLVEAAESIPLVHRFSNIESAISQSSLFSGVVIASPTKFHVEQTKLALEAKLPVLLEKPVSLDAASAATLVQIVQDTQVPLLLGYTYRWWPAIQELKRQLEQRVIGKVLHVHCVMSAHLADWHPWERYQDFFMASKELGGGALLDESHFLDLMLWFFGQPSEVFARVDRLSNLEIETDDTVDAWLGYSNGMQIMIHLDLYGRPHERSITIRGDQGTLVWSYDPNSVRFSASAQQDWQDTVFSCERNEMFLNVAKEFVQILDKDRLPSCSIDDGYAVMRALEAMRQSSASGQVIRLE